MDCGVKIYTMKLNDEFLKKFEKNFTKNVKLSNYSWFNLGGNAEFFFKPNDKNQLLDFFKDHPKSEIKKIVESKNLKIGDIINVTFPELAGGKSKKIDESMSGNYLIARLNHHMQPNASFSSLNLIRDSYGYSEAYPVGVLQSGTSGEDDTELEVDNNSSIPSLPNLK